jgi:hypothetical protein
MAILVSLDTPNQDVRSPEDRFLATVKEKIDKKNYVSVPNVTTFNFSLWEPSATAALPFTINYNGFWAYPVPMKVVLLPNPKIDLQMQEVKEVVLTLNLYEIPTGSMGYQGPNGSGNFTIRFTVSFSLVKARNGRLPIDFVNNNAFCETFTLSFPTTNPEIDWTIQPTSVKSFRLSDTIELRGFIQQAPDFTHNPNKLTKPQFNLICSEGVYLVATFGFAYDDYFNLSTANQKLVDELFRAGLYGSSLYMLGLDVKLNYFGFLSSFPTNV